MATTRLMPLHTGKGRTVGQAISAIIDYTKNPQKTDGGRLITSWQCDSRIADAEFLFAKNQYTQKTGRVRGEDDVIAYHLRQSFVPGEITPEDANRLGCELAKRFTKGNHAYIVCTHIDKAHIHNHVIWNSTALSQTRKFRNFWGSSRAVRRLNDTICIENGYSIVENPKRHGKSYNKWLGDKKKPSHRERICAAIDDALTQKPDSFETLLELLRQAGYEVKGKKVPSLLGGEQKKSIRMDTLGDGYTPADLRAVIAGEKAHTPRKSAAPPVKPQKRSGNLLVDIQAKLRAGKGAGYARQKAEYESLLDISGQGVMGYIEIPEIDVSLPIYHGTEDPVLQVAVGHLEWSSLPVGGESTHCVLSGHRGLPSAKLFTNLDKLREGDTFLLRVLDEILTYEVDQILIVEPQDTAALEIAEGEDYCTLVTCTPYGINTHRLLVRGHRIDNIEEVKTVRVTADAVQIEPMLVAPVVAIPMLLILLILLLLPRRRKK